MQALVIWSVVVVAACVGCAPRSAHEAAPPTGVLRDFHQLVSAYAALQREEMRAVPAATQTADGGKADRTGRDLSARMRRARATSRQGDIFTAPVAAVLRQKLNAELRGTESANTRASIRDDAPKAFPITVNMEFPGGSLPTMPPNVLKALPTLPEGLEYRIVETHLILRDTHANIVVDYLPDVMCAKC